ncbi:MAG: hypothetical protein JWM12_3014 [Ilumatobacteraceae bacterium]|nr:hypothetical protein [Ilumatobacteraceae bacterium]
MNDAFLLGAGFSMAVGGPSFPSTNGLGEAAIKMQQSVHDALVDGSHSHSCDGLSCDNPQLVNGRWPAPTFEQWLSLLADQQPWLFPQENDRNHAMFGDLTSALSLQLALAMDQSMDRGGPPGWFRSLVECWLDRETEIVTFNYDTFVEAAIEEVLTRGSSLGLRTPVRYGGLVADSLPVGLAKLHGSLNWFWDATSQSAESIEARQIARTWLDPGTPHASQGRRIPGKETFIIPPTSAKSAYYDNSVVRALWRQAYESLRSAARVVAIGYSFPPEDTVAIGMLRRALGVRSAELILVNPDPSLPERVTTLLGGAPSQIFGGLECVQEFAAYWVANGGG